MKPIDEIHGMISKMLAARPLSAREPGPDDARGAALVQRHILDVLAEHAVTPNDLSEATLGRVSCPVEHRETLRALIARSGALEPGMQVPWRLTGDLAGGLRWAQRKPACVSADEANRPAESWHWGPMLVLVFLTSAAQHAPWLWRWRIRYDAAAALATARAIDLIRVAFECRELSLVFAPPDAQEQDFARRIVATEKGIQSRLESHLHTQAMLDRVMRT
jgi:hypothetical protein